MKLTIIIILSSLFGEKMFTSAGGMTIVYMNKIIPPDVPPKITFNNTGIVLKRDVTFSLFTPKNLNNSQQLFVNNIPALKQSDFNYSIPTTIVTHGWQSSCATQTCTSIRDGFFSHGMYNVILVDWSSIASLDYIDSAARVQLVGSYVASMIDFLANQGASRSNITLAGHSLGAHVVGIAGYLTDGQVSHIVGMDPANPGFQLQGPDGKISKMAGALVEIVHTNAGILGVPDPHGHIDYYPNGGGPEQPGCGADVTCSHSRSYYYYAESLTYPDKWLAIKCDNQADFLAGRCKNNMIEPFARWWAYFFRPHGIYQLRTRSSPPFGLGVNGTKPDIANITSSITSGVGNVVSTLSKG